MEYVEILRARRILTWYTGFLIAGLDHRSHQLLRQPRAQQGRAERWRSACWPARARWPRSSSQRCSTRAQCRGCEYDRAHLDPAGAPRRDRVAFRRGRRRRDRHRLRDHARRDAHRIAIVGALPQSRSIRRDHAHRHARLGRRADVVRLMISVAAARLPGRGPLLAGLAGACSHSSSQLCSRHVPRAGCTTSSTR